MKNEFLWFFEKVAWYEFQLLLSLAFNLKKSLYNARITILVFFNMVMHLLGIHSKENIYKEIFTCSS